jgi:hypothetical protein
MVARNPETMAVHGDTDDSDAEDDSNVEMGEENSFCENCHRRNSNYLRDNFEGIYEIHFTSHPSDTIRLRRKFKMMTIGRDRICQCTLCTECKNHLTVSNNKEALKSENTWPSFIWMLLSSTNIHNMYGRSVWKFIPTPWRYWWVQELKELYPNTFSQITILDPSPVFIDRTMEITEWDRDINSFELPKLARACNKYLIPKVMCPWGCTEYTHQSGYLEFDLIIQRYLPKCLIAKLMSNVMKLNLTFSARDDYIRREGDEDRWLLNPDWKIEPSVIIIKGMGPMVLTCRDHHGGDKKFMIHPCRQPHHNLPAGRADQLCHAVVKCRTVRPMKFMGQYSNAFQMHSQRGNFNGIDTISYSTYGKFGSCSYLESEIEARTIQNRPDINALLNNLVKERVISKFAADEKRKESSRISEGTNFQKYISGATYVPLHVAMKLQQSLANPSKTIVIIDNRGDALPDIPVEVKVCWPVYIYPCQSMNKYGVISPKIPSYRHRNGTSTWKYKFLWHLYSLITGMESLWRIIASEIELRRSNWHGWILVYLTDHCFPNLCRKQSNNDPFKKSHIAAASRLIDKVLPTENSITFLQYFGNMAKILCVDYSTQDGSSLNEVLENMIDVNSHEVVMVENFIICEDDELKDSYVLQGMKYKLCCVSMTWTINNRGNWSSHAYRRHLDDGFTSWWYQGRNDHMPIKVQRASCVDGQSYVLGLVRSLNNDMRKLGIEFMSYIGGKTHMFCERHQIPLIASTKRNGLCACGKKEWYCCSQIGCKVKVCKQCADALNQDTVTFITMNQENEDESIKSDESIESDESTVSDEELTHDGEESHQRDFEDDDSTGSIILTRDDFDDFITASDEPDMPFSENPDEESEFDMGTIPTTDTGEYAYVVEDQNITSGRYNDVVVSGNVVMNQCGTLLTRKKHQIKGSSVHKWFMQRICATNIGTSIPLLYPEAMLFPSLFYMMVQNNGSFCGAFPSALLTESISDRGFQSIPQHVRSRLSSATHACGSNPRYTSYCFDLLTNLSANHQDIRVSLNRGLHSAGDKYGGLKVRRKEDSSLHQSVDGTQNTKNLCASQPYHPMDYFITMSCNQKKHFGVKSIKKWVDGKEWTKHFHGWDEDLTKKEKQKYSKQFDRHQLHFYAAIGRKLRNWS